MRALAANVALRHPSTGTLLVLGPGSPVPDWATALITNPDVWADEPANDETDAEPDADDAHDNQADDVELLAAEAPPTSGRGSGRDAWAAYASSRGIDIQAAATRDEIIAAVEDAGEPIA